MNLDLKLIENKSVAKIFSELPNVIAILVIIWAIYTCFSIAALDRSLWLDEGMLTFSFSSRTLTDLTSDVLESNQSAPVIYLYIVKLITLIFGDNEVTLRSWSLVSYILTLFMSYIVLSRILKLKYPLIGVAFIATFQELVRYSNEFKPYMNDCWSVLAIIILYYFYDKEKINILILSLCYAIFVWLSNPTCFFIGGILLYEVAKGLKSKNMTTLKNMIICGSVVFISFVVYYFYWIKPVIDIGFMKYFWSSSKLPFPRDLDSFKRAGNLILNIIENTAQPLNLIYVIGMFSWIYNFIYAKNKYISCIYLGILVMLFASMLGYHPINIRLCLFLLPLLGILTFFFINEIYSSKDIKINIVVTAILLTLVIPFNGLGAYSDKEKIRRYGAETNAALMFIKNNIKDNESLYIHEFSYPGYNYKCKLTDENNRIIFNNPTFIGPEFYSYHKAIENMDEAVDIVVNNSPTYLLFSHTEIIDKRASVLIEALQREGRVEVVYDDNYGTFVSYFIKDEKNDSENK
jgi:hypothetical protein